MEMRFRLTESYFKTYVLLQFLIFFFFFYHQNEDSRETMKVVIEDAALMLRGDSKLVKHYIAKDVKAKESVSTWKLSRVVQEAK